MMSKTDVPAADQPQAEPSRMTAADLAAGPCALPAAPMAMPSQVIEPKRGVRHGIAALMRRALPSQNVPT
ncbi:hypothetical protein ACFO5Z_10215 [Salipiger abyssi]